MSRSRFIVLASLGMLVLVACTAPRAPVTVTRLSVPALGLDAGAAPAVQADWWRALGDPQLDRLVAAALADNPTLEAALARVRGAQSLLATADAARRPQLTVDGSVQRQRLSDAYIIPPPYGGSTRGIGDIQANLGWDLDFWGRQAAAVGQARAEAGAVALDYAAARLALAGSVVQTYIDLARSERQLATAQAVLDERSAALGLVQLRVRSQLDSGQAVRTAQTLLAEARQDLVQAQARREALVHACALLAGRGADYYATLEPPVLVLDAALPLPDTLPADLLARRPDILAAQARITAAMAGREVARSDFYPNINLVGLAGVQAIGLGKLFTSDAATYGAGAAVHLPIFDGGRLRAAYAGANARADGAVADYNGAVLDAVREAADALTRVQSLARALEAQREASAGITALQRLEEARFGAGLGSRLQLIEAGLRALAAGQAVTDLEADQVTARVRLLVALGGGFDPEHLATVTDTRSSP